MADTAAAATPAADAHHGHGDHHPHVVPTKFLAGILGALLVLTVVTYLAAQVDLGAANVPIAIAIATVKASLVALFFMHLRWDRPFNGLILLISLGGLALFLSLALLDTAQYQDQIRHEYAAEKMKSLKEGQAAGARATGE